MHINFFNKNNNFRLREMSYIDVTEDPVRPELDLTFRTSYGRKIFGLYGSNEKDLHAVICIAFTSDIPKSVEDMDKKSQDAYLQSIHRENMAGPIAVAYTVWAKKKGGGKHILNEIYKKFKREKHIDRLVTLSPMTDMAHDFHIKNGAKLIQVNEDTQNFEYNITLEKWQEHLERIKSKIAI